MTPYEAEYVKDGSYEVHSLVLAKRVPASFREHAGRVIDSEWRGSWYWGGNGQEWWVDATNDCKAAIASYKARLSLLQSTLETLETIVPHED